MGVLKSYYRRKLLWECVNEWGYDEEVCRQALEQVEGMLEKRIETSIRQAVLSASRKLKGENSV